MLLQRSQKRKMDEKNTFEQHLWLTTQTKSSSQMKTRPALTHSVENCFQLFTGWCTHRQAAKFHQLLTGMKALHMSVQTINMCELLSTIITLIWGFTSVNLHVWLEMTTRCTSMSTHLTLMRFFTGVNPHVNLQVVGSVALIITHITFVWGFAGVDTHVFPQITSFPTLIPANLAYEWKFLCVYQHVTCQATFVAETSSTFSTLEHLFVRVNS